MSNCQSVSTKTCLLIFGSMISSHTHLTPSQTSYNLVIAPQTSMEMQEWMVVWHTKLGKSTVEIATLAGCSEHTVREVLWLHRETGVVHNTFAQSHGSPQSLNQGDVTYISSLLNTNPTLYLDKLKIKLSS